MEIKPIKTKRDYEAALKDVESLMDAKRNSAEGDQLDVLVTLVEAYEARHFPLDLPDPVEAIKYAMEQQHLTVKDLVPFIGQPNRVYEVLNRKRPLTMAMVWKLHKGLGIPAESLISQAREPGQSVYAEEPADSEYAAMPTRMTSKQQAKRIYAICAGAKTLLTYGEVLEHLGYDASASGHAIRYGLELVRIACLERGLPVLTAIVVNKSTAMPSDTAFPGDVSHWKAQVKAVFACRDWPPVDEIDWNDVWQNRQQLSAQFGLPDYWRRK